MTADAGAAETMRTQSAEALASPVVRRLRIERFRGIEALDWTPAAGVNIVLGGGDSGKTTILEALAMLLSPSNSAVASDTDYFGRDREAGFLISAVMTLPAESGVHHQNAQCYPWAWDGEDAAAPQNPEDGSPAPAPDDPVFKVQVRGTPDLDLEYEMECPSGAFVSFPPSLRRAIGLVRLAGDDRGDRDLRLVNGSALDRLLTDKSLRARLAVEFSQDEVKGSLDEEGAQALEQLDRSFEKQQLPHHLGLGLNVGQGQSVSALIGLTAKPGEVRLPLVSWGAGTRRLASLAVARACRTGCPIMLIDEAERGLEPYRQRALARELMEGPSQVFVTTHSACVLSASKGAKVWHLTAAQEIGPLDATLTAAHQKRDPETFLSRLAIVAEGATEVGFVSEVLSRELGADLLDLGVHVTDAKGNDFSLTLMQEMSRARFRFAGFVDNEGRKGETWAALKGVMAGLLMQWPQGCTESNVIRHLKPQQIAAFVAGEDRGVTQQRVNTLIERLQYGRETRLDFPKHTLEAVAAHAGLDLLRLIEAAACGYTPQGMGEDEAKSWKKHPKVWFKHEAGGRELAEKVYSLELRQALAPELNPFVDAVRLAALGTAGA